MRTVRRARVSAPGVAASVLIARLGRPRRENELPEKVIIGDAELWLGDCREVLPMMPKVDLILTDPPYGIGACGGTGKYGRLKIGAKDPAWDSDTPPHWLILLLMEQSDYQIVFGGNYFDLPPSRNYLVWDKGAGFKGRDFAECEFAWCSWDGNAKVLTRDPLANRDYAGKEHPTQKPVPVMEWALGQAPSDVSTICDPFMGSGTTGVACVNLGKRFIGIEREPKYFEIACKRITHAVEQQKQRLFEPGPKPQPETPCLGLDESA
jgi:DNA modification methylase